MADKNDGDNIDEILSLDGWSDAQLKAFRAHRGMLDEIEGIEDEHAMEIYEVLEYNAAIEDLDALSDKLERLSKSLQVTEDPGVDAGLVREVANMAGVPAPIVEVVIFAIEQVCDVCISKK